MANTDDLRYIRTEGAIRDAFMGLVAERSVSSVTVSELCRRAGISRNAFYLHYSGVQVLYSALVGELVSDIRSEGLASSKRRASTGRDDALVPSLVDALARREGLLRALRPSDDGTLSKSLSGGIADALVDAALYFGERGGNFEHRLRCAYTAWGIVGFVSLWVSRTERPLSEALPHFEELQASAIEASATYLMKEGQKPLA